MRSTKQTDRKCAQAVAKAWELVAEKARHGELTQAAILKGMGDLLERTTGERLNVASVQDFFAEWLNSKATVGRASSTVKRYRPILDGFLAAIGAKRAGASIASINPAEIERFRDSELAEGKGEEHRRHGRPGPARRLQRRPAQGHRADQPGGGRGTLEGRSQRNDIRSRKNKPVSF